MKAVPSRLLQDRLTTFCVLEQSDLITCRVWTVSASEDHDTRRQEYAESRSLSSSARKRLRTAESEAKNLGFPCYIEPSSSHLWVFYRRSASDVDWGDFGSKHGLETVESQSLNFSIEELLEDSRLTVYQNFLYSLLAKLDDSMNRTSHMTLLNARTVVIRSLNGDVGELASHECLSIARLDLQLTDSKLVLSVKELRNKNLKSVDSLIKSKAIDSLQPQSDALLAPCGKVVRYKGIRHPHEDNVERAESLHRAPFHQSSWQSSVLSWLQNYGIEPDADEAWVDIEVIIPWETDVKADQEGGKERDLHMLQSILWPSSLIFSRSRQRKANTNSHYIDPLGAAENWLCSSDIRAESAGKRKAKRMSEQVQRDRAVLEPSGQDFNVSSPAIIRPDIHSLAAIYPTPPDGPLSHVTPGMSSVEGAGATPHGVDTLLLEPPDRHGEDVSMLDNSRPSGPDLFNDDLFEGDAGENSESGEIDENPDWDFFDEPGEAMDHDEENMDTSESGPFTQAPEHFDETPRVLPALEDVNFAQETNGLEDIPSNPVVEPSARKEQTEQGGGVSKSPISPKGPTDREDETREITVARNTDLETSVSRENKLSLGDETSLRWSDDSKYLTEGGKFWFGPVAKLGVNVGASNGPSQLQVVEKPNLRRLNTSRNPLDEDQTSNSPTSPLSGSTSFDSNDLFQDEGDKTEDLWAGLKRKWAETTSSPLTSVLGVEDAERRAVEASHFALLDNLFDDSSPSSMEDWLAFEEPDDTIAVPTKADDQVQIAQLLVDQVSQSFLFSDLFQSCVETCDMTPILERLAKSLTLIFRASIQPSLAQILNTFASVDAEDNMFMCETPKLRFRKADRDLEALPPLMPFWETFGLQPVSGKRDVLSLCLCPENESIVECSQSFMSQLSHVYQGCSLGEHSADVPIKLAENGFVTFKYDASSQTTDLLDVCKALGTELANSSLSTTVVLYIIHPITRPEILLDIYHSLFVLHMTYAKGAQDSRRPRTDIVPQLLPLSFVSTNDYIVTPPQADFFRLALEVYDRCPAMDSRVQDPGTTSPAILLAEQPSKDLTFKLSKTGAVPLQSGNKSLHVAYCLTTDQRWLTAVWTDEHGKQAFTMSYCLRFKNADISQGRSILEIIREIWKTSFDLLCTANGQKRIVVAREGSLDTVEKNAWIHCFNGHVSSAPSPSGLSLVLLSTDSEPSFHLSTPTILHTAARRAPGPPSIGQAQNTPTTAAFSFSSTNNVPALYGTPVTTPTPSAAQSVLSPEQTMTANTPGAMSALTPTPISNTTHNTSQISATPSQSPATRQTASHMQTTQSQTQTQSSGPPTTQAQSEIQNALEADPSSFLSLSGSQYIGILLPFAPNQTSSFLDMDHGHRTAYLLRTQSEVEVAGSKSSVSSIESNTETVLGVNLVWTSTTDDLQLTAKTNKGTIAAPGVKRSFGTDVEDSDLIPDPAISASTSPAKSAISGGLSYSGSPTTSASQDTQRSVSEGHLLLRDILPIYRNLITLSETRGLGYVGSVSEKQQSLRDFTSVGVSTRRRERILPWHIMTAVRGKTVLEKCGL